MKLNELSPDVLKLIEHLVKSPAVPNGIDPEAELPTPNGFYVLCLQYVRPETVTTRGGMTLILASQTRKEDEYQGRLGIVLALGADCYRDEVKFPGGAWVKPGDIVAWPALENAAGRYSFGNATLAAITDDRLVLRGCDPAFMVGR